MPPPQRTVAIIPARYRSKRLPAKPLADIAGKPMIAHVYERVARARLIDDVIVATDDDRIAHIVRQFGGNVIMTPDTVESGTDRVAFAAASTPADIIVNVQGDEPLLKPEMVDEAVQPLIDDGALKVGTLVRVIESQHELTNPNIVKVVLDKDCYCLYFSRSVIPHERDSRPDKWPSIHTYYKHIGLYVFRKTFLSQFTSLQQTPLELTENLEQLRILENGFRIKAAVTTYDSIPVDTQEDLERVRMIMGKKHE